jgi:hypothetical protein
MSMEDGIAVKDKDNNVANMNAVCPPSSPSTLLLLRCAVTIGGIPPSIYSLSRGENNNNNVGKLVGMASYLGNQLCSHQEDDADGGSENNVDNVMVEEGGSYINNLDDKLLSLLCLNNG